MPSAEYFLTGVGLIAGFIDSIAGGGGLIALPAMSLVVGPGIVRPALLVFVPLLAARVIAVYA